MFTWLVLHGVAAVETMDVGALLTAAQSALGRTFQWAGAFDTRLIGCPTIIIQEH